MSYTRRITSLTLAFFCAIVLQGCNEDDMQSMAESAKECYRTLDPKDLSCVKSFYNDVVIPQSEPFAEGAVIFINEMDPTQ